VLNYGSQIKQHKTSLHVLDCIETS